MKRFIYSLIIFFSGLMLMSCVTGEILPTNYYILEYLKHTEQEEIFRNESYDVSVMIHQAKIPQTYNRKQLVIRCGIETR